MIGFLTSPPVVGTLAVIGGASVLFTFLVVFVLMVTIYRDLVADRRARLTEAISLHPASLDSLAELVASVDEIDAEAIIREHQSKEPS